jgi:hypothetical protein
VPRRLLSRGQNWLGSKCYGNVLSGNQWIAPCIIRLIQSRRMSCAEYVADMEEKRNSHSFGGKTEGKRSLGRPRHTSEDNSKMGLKLTHWKCVWTRFV